MMKSELYRAHADKRRLFFTLLIVIGVSLALGALSLGTYSALWTTNSAIHEVLGHWVQDVLIGTATGVIVIAIVTKLIKLFGIEEENSHSATQEGSAAGIRRLFKNWAQDMPSSAQMYELFVAAEVVHIAAVSLFRSLIGYEWFPEALAARIKAKRETRIMMLDPDGFEIKRRELEPSGRQIEGPCRESAVCISRGLQGAEVEKERAGDFFRVFDFAPSCNYMRLGNTVFLVLFNYGSGGSSPAIELESSGWMAVKYDHHFEQMWTDTAKTPSGSRTVVRA